MALSFDDACLGHGGPVRQETPSPISRHLATRAPSSVSSTLSQSPSLQLSAMASYDAVAVSSANSQHTLFTLIHVFHYRHCTGQSRPSLLTFPSASSPTSPSSSSWPPLASHFTSPRKHPRIPHAASSPTRVAHQISSLPKTAVIREIAVASTASVFGGFGVVALFCSVGVYL